MADKLAPDYEIIIDMDSSRGKELREFYGGTWRGMATLGLLPVGGTKAGFRRFLGAKLNECHPKSKLTPIRQQLERLLREVR